MLRRVLSLYLPLWPIDLVRRRRRGEPAAARRDGGVAMVLAAGRYGQQVVACCCERSATAGVRAGMSVSHARALLAGERVEVGAHEPGRDAAALDAMARWAVRFSPSVAVDGPDGLLLDVTGCRRLYGDERALMREVGSAVCGLGFSGVRMGIAPTVGCAWAVARFGGGDRALVAAGEERGVLERLPVGALRVDGQVREALSEVGIDWVGQLFRLSRAELSARFGDGLLLRLDQATGEAFEPIEPVRVAEPVRVEREFDGATRRADAVRTVARMLVEQLARRLARREQGVRRMVLEVERLDAGALREVVVLSRASRGVGHLWALVYPKVERLNMGYGVQRMALVAERVGKLPHGQGRCWERDRSGDRENGGEALGQWMDMVVDRVGPQRVGRFEVVATHVPERVFKWRPVLEEQRAGKRSRGYGAQVGVGDRPSVLYARPVAVQVVTMAPDGPVVTVRWAGDEHRVVTTIGPERVVRPWWDSDGDLDLGAAPAARDYFKVQDEQGRWLWIYRAWGAGGWFVHGWWG